MTRNWKVIIGRRDLNVRVGDHSEPKFLGADVFEFSRKSDAVKKFGESIQHYMDKSYDWKGHSMGALKFYWEEDIENSEDKNDFLTHVLLHYKDVEYSDLDPKELNRYLK